MLSDILHQLRDVPEYFVAVKAAAAVLLSGLPLYGGLWYFSHRRRLNLSFGMTLNFVSVFILFSGLAFVLASPLASYLPEKAISAYLFLTCIAAAFSVVSLIDVFLLQHYLRTVKKMYVSPPLRTIIKFSVFCVALLLILRYVLHFNPLALVAIPTIAAAGIALALQDTLKTFFAGVSMGNIIRLGEWISFQDKVGQVVDINWSRTVLRTTDGNYVFLPNSQLQTGIFQNFTTGDPSNRLQLKVGASYDAAPGPRERSHGQLRAECSRRGRAAPKRKYRFAGIRQFRRGLLASIIGWKISAGSRKCRMMSRRECGTPFAGEGIEIPYPTRTLYMRQETDATKAKTEQVSHGASSPLGAGGSVFPGRGLGQLGQFAQNPQLCCSGETIVNEREIPGSLYL